MVIEPGCRRCPQLVASRTCIAWGNGAPDAAIMVVGEAPGTGDPDADVWKGGNHTGCAYTSRHSGRRIRRLLAELGHAGNVYYTNAVKCHPSDGDGSSRPPTPTELGSCRTHLETEIDTISPEVILATGKHATQTLLAFDGRSIDGFVQKVCEPITIESLSASVLPVLHPSYRDVWLSRLGLTRSEYRERIARHLP